MLAFMAGCSQSKILIELEKTPLVKLKKTDAVLILPFSFNNISSAKDVYMAGSDDFSNELYKRLTKNGDYNITDLNTSKEIYSTYFSQDEEDVSLDVIRQISSAYDIEYIISGRIEFNTLDASSYDRKREYDSRYGRYITYNIWVRRRKFIVNLDYRIYSSYEDKYIKEETKTDNLIVEEEYQRQVYGFWQLIPSMIDGIVDVFIPKKVETSKYILD